MSNTNLTIGHNLNGNAASPDATTTPNDSSSRVDGGPLTVNADADNKKHGSATCHSYLGLCAVGDASIEAAAKAGGITKIHHVDFKSHSVIGIYAEFTTIVYGE